MPNNRLNYPELISSLLGWPIPQAKNQRLERYNQAYSIAHQQLLALSPPLSESEFQYEMQKLEQVIDSLEEKYSSHFSTAKSDPSSVHSTSRRTEKKVETSDTEPSSIQSSKKSYKTFGLSFLLLCCAGGLTWLLWPRDDLITLACISDEQLSIEYDAKGNIRQQMYSYYPDVKVFTVGTATDKPPLLRGSDSLEIKNKHRGNWEEKLKGLEATFDHSNDDSDDYKSSFSEKGPIFSWSRDQGKPWIRYEVDLINNQVRYVYYQWTPASDKTFSLEKHKLYRCKRQANYEN